MNTARYFLLALIIGALVLTYIIFQPFLAPLVLAAVFAAILQPVRTRILRTMPNWPSMASVITVLVGAIFVLVPLAVIGTQIGIQAGNLYGSLANGDTRAEVLQTAHAAEAAVTRIFPQASGFADSLAENVSGYARQVLSWLAQNIGSAAAGIASFALSLFVFLIALYYLLRDGNEVKEWVIAMSPLRDTHDRKVVKRLETAVNSVIKGSLTISFLQGVVSGVGYAIFGVPNAILWGTLTAIAALIPGVGTALVLAPIILYLVITGSYVSALGLLAWGATAVGLIDNLLGPRLIGSGVNLHPLLILLAVLGGVSLFGPIGIFLGPLALSLLFALLSIYREMQQDVVA